MKKFISENILMIVMVVLFVLSETFHLLFANIQFGISKNGTILNYDSPVYYFMSQLGGIGLVPSLFIYFMLPKNKLASRGIATGMVLVEFKELLGEITYLFKVNIHFLDRITINKGFKWEVIFIVLVILFTYLWYVRHGIFNFINMCIDSFSDYLQKCNNKRKTDTSYQTKDNPNG